MKQRPILFSTPMVQAILEGRKTQTRRVVKPQPPVENIDEEPCIDYDRGVEKGSMENPVIYAEWAEWQDEFVNNTTEPIESHCVYSPFGKEGDVLWVRETFRPKGHSFPIGEHFEYKATAEADGNPTDEPWKPSIFMPKDAARIWLRIANVRVERLQDISEEDAIAEGVDELFDSSVEERWKNYGLEPYNKPLNDPASSFMTLWWRINGIDSWELNPWVWVIEFERIEKPIINEK